MSACCCRRVRWPGSSTSSVGALAFGFRPCLASRSPPPCTHWCPGKPTTRRPTLYDLLLFALFGLAISAQPLIYGMTRQLVDPRNAGKALSAINLAFFLGAALMQSATGIVAAAYGLPAVLIFMALVLIVGTIL